MFSEVESFIESLFVADREKRQNLELTKVESGFVSYIMFVQCLECYSVHQVSVSESPVCIDRGSFFFI